MRARACVRVWIIIVHTNTSSEGIKEDKAPYLSSSDKMFREWYNMKPLKDDAMLTIRVHFGRNYPNAFWNGVNATFGDGRGSFHPFVSIDLVGHEVRMLRL